MNAASNQSPRCGSFPASSIVLSYPDFAYYLAPALKDISANSGSNVMSDLFFILQTGEESAQSDLLLGGLLPI